MMVNYGQWLGDDATRMFTARSLYGDLANAYSNVVQQALAAGYPLFLSCSVSQEHAPDNRHIVTLIATR